MRTLIINYKNVANKRLEKFFTILIVLLCVIFILKLSFMLFYGSVYVEGDSMKGTLLNGDYVYEIKRSTPRRGDIVTIETDEIDPSTGKPKVIIKRVIALENDTVELVKGVLYLNGELKEEPYVEPRNNDPFKSINTLEQTITVPKGYMFCMGDNRNSSYDSRYKENGNYRFFKVSQTKGVVAEWSMSVKGFITVVNRYIEQPLQQLIGK